jgi:uncharacterized membrane protein (UPF0127 family)
MTGLATVTVDGSSWTCQVASTPAELEQGLSGVASMPDGEGMLFDLGSERIVTINTYNMLFPLSIAIISEDLKIVGVIITLSIGTEITTNVPCRYFLELNDGQLTADDYEKDVVITGYTPPSSNIFDSLVSFMVVAMMMQMMIKSMKEVK